LEESHFKEESGYKDESSEGVVEERHEKP